MDSSPLAWLQVIMGLGSPVTTQWIDPTTHCTMSERSYHRATSCSLVTGTSLRTNLMVAGQFSSGLAPGYSWFGLPSDKQRIDPMTHRTMSERSYHGATSRSLVTGTSLRTNLMVAGQFPSGPAPGYGWFGLPSGITKDWSDDPLHYISLPSNRDFTKN